MMNRKELKKAAKQTLKRHYKLLVVLCLFAAFLKIEYGASFWGMNIQDAIAENQQITLGGNLQSVVTDMVLDQDTARQHVSDKKANILENDTNPMFGHTRGVLSSVVNSFSSGGVIVSINDALASVVHSGTVAVALLVFISLCVYLFVWLFIKETFLIVIRRMVLESRTYEKVPLQRLLFHIQTGQWVNMAMTMFVKNIYQYLWNLTIIGGFIKYYSYLMVPYIMAENPKMNAKDAITLSRRMMDGHKFECFVAGLSFLGWDILNLVTLGISGILFSNPYEASFYGEYYTYLRSLAKEKQIPGSEALCDTYLYEKALHRDLYQVYSDVTEAIYESPGRVEKPRGFVGFVSEWLGILPVFSPAVVAYEEQKGRDYQIARGQDILDGRTYPGRMGAVPLKFRMNITTDLTATRSYTVLNLVLLFFIFSFVGWLWEVSLHLISDGEFVNRGVLHGPWLPIYGMGGIAVLILLKKLREYPIAEFIATVVVCGALEYSVAWNLEMTHNGQKWWDYTGYFLNLHGRICAEGLLTFGLGGLAIVYVVAPTLDNQLKKLNRKVLAVIAAVLLVLYIGDQMYSSKNPNTGKGITDYTSQVDQIQQYSDNGLNYQDMSLLF